MKPRAAMCNATRAGPQARGQSASGPRPIRRDAGLRMRPRRPPTRLPAGAGGFRAFRPGLRADRPAQRRAERRARFRQQQVLRRATAHSAIRRAAWPSRFATSRANSTRPWRPGSASSARRPAMRAVRRPHKWMRVSASDTKDSPRFCSVTVQIIRSRSNHGGHHGKS